MTDQNAELSTDEKLQQAIEDYGKLQIAKAFDRRTFQPDSFESFWGEIKSECKFELAPDNTLTVGGQSADIFVERLRQGNPKLKQYFARPDEGEESSQSHPDSVQNKSESPKVSEPEVMFVSRQQLVSRQFMLEAGGEIGKAIQDGRIKVDDSRAEQDGYRIREFLAPKAIEGAEQKPEVKPVPKPRTITKAESMNRAFTLKLEQEWQAEGGYLAAISKGLIKVV